MDIQQVHRFQVNLRIPASTAGIYSRGTIHRQYRFQIRSLFLLRLERIQSKRVQIVHVHQIDEQIYLQLSQMTECFTVRYLWCTNVCFNFEFTTHTVNKNIKVKFTHTSDDYFVQFLHQYVHGMLDLLLEAFARAIPILSWSAFDLGSTDN